MRSITQREATLLIIVDLMLKVYWSFTFPWIPFGYTQIIKIFGLCFMTYMFSRVLFHWPETKRKIISSDKPLDIEEV